MSPYLVPSIARHFAKSVYFYRLTAVYLVVGVAIVTAHVPFWYTGASEPSGQQVTEYSAVAKIPVLSRLRLDIGVRNVAFFHVVRIAIAGWLAFLGAFWDVRRRMKEWALIRLFGGYPCLVAGFHFFCLSFVGMLIGGGFALLVGPPRSLDDVIRLISLTLGWGFLFSFCVTIGLILYTELFHIVSTLRIEGEVR